MGNPFHYGTTEHQQYEDLRANITNAKSRFEEAKLPKVNPFMEEFKRLGLR